MLEGMGPERPLDGGLTPIDAVNELAKANCPNQWSRYCQLAQQFARLKGLTGISQEDAGREHLAANGKSVAQTLAWQDGMSRGYALLAGGGASSPCQLETVVAEAKSLEDLFRNQLVLALQTDRYSLAAYDRLSPVTVAPGLIKPEQFRFGGDEMLVGDGIKLTGVRFVPNRPASAAQSEPPGRKPGHQPIKDLACSAVLSILVDDAQRPPPGHGRKAALARMVHPLLPDGERYKLNTIEKLIRGSIKEWEVDNPDR
jgi:hypothetical protein